MQTFGATSTAPPAVQSPNQSLISNVQMLQSNSLPLTFALSPPPQTLFGDNSSTAAATALQPLLQPDSAMPKPENGSLTPLLLENPAMDSSIAAAEPAAASEAAPQQAESAPVAAAAAATCAPTDTVKRKPGKPRGKNTIRWTEEFDDKLREVVIKYGARNWKKIAQEVGGGFTADQCNQHWHRVLNPRIVKGEWTQAEDELLCARVAEFGESSWTKISEAIPGRTDIQCRHRYYQRKKDEEDRAKSAADQANSAGDGGNSGDAESAAAAAADQPKTQKTRKSRKIKGLQLLRESSGAAHVFSSSANDFRISEVPHLDFDPNSWISKFIASSLKNGNAQSEGVTIDGASGATAADAVAVAAASVPAIPLAQLPQSELQEDDKDQFFKITFRIDEDTSRIHVGIIPGAAQHLPSLIPPPTIDLRKRKLKVFLPFCECEDDALANATENGPDAAMAATSTPDFAAILVRNTTQFHPLRNKDHLAARYEQLQLGHAQADGAVPDPRMGILFAIPQGTVLPSSKALVRKIEIPTQVAAVPSVDELGRIKKRGRNAAAAANTSAASEPAVPKKRGRKPKKRVPEAESSESILITDMNGNILTPPAIDENGSLVSAVEAAPAAVPTAPKKRGRKRKAEVPSPHSQPLADETNLPKRKRVKRTDIYSDEFVTEPEEAEVDEEPEPEAPMLLLSLFHNSRTATPASPAPTDHEEKEGSKKRKAQEISQEEESGQTATDLSAATHVSFISRKRLRS